ncbi:MAG TPA: M55 family metallopeptidase [Candidatus Limiplasma sp.]|nr:M55 family metallopeptidase [Candidatus Limiplasma sp.]HRX08628.1 M55 family metallopeptidase [Candidatus Limiplasma sp.]
MKIYLSADMEGTAGIIDWNETTADHPQYAYFQQQMTREVAAACQGAIAAGATEILVKDAHDSARNIIPDQLPEQTRLFRGWDNTPAMMMAGLDESFDGVLFTGYHAAACTDTNPLSHTMSLKVQSLKCNGKLIAEYDLNAMIAASLGVPVYFLSGDRGLCLAAKDTSPQLMTVATNEGFGPAAVSLHPHTAATRIRETVRAALQCPKPPRLYPLPDRFTFEICYKEHSYAKRASCYPGIRQLDAKTVVYETKHYTDALHAMFFIL